MAGKKSVRNNQQAVRILLLEWRLQHHPHHQQAGSKGQDVHLGLNSFSAKVQDDLTKVCKVHLAARDGKTYEVSAVALTIFQHK